MTYTVKTFTLTNVQAQVITDILKNWNKPYILRHTPIAPPNIKTNKKRISLGYITDLGLKKGDVFECVKDSSKTVRLLTDTTVFQNGLSVSLSKATIIALNSRHKGFAGIGEWMYNGEILRNRAKRMGLIKRVK